MLSPLQHNFLSYFGAAAVFLYAFSTRTDIDSSFSTAHLGALLWTVHFVRRSAETILVFKFSGDKIDISDSIVEFVYYWAFGYWIALALDSSQAAFSTSETPLIWTQGFLGLCWWGSCEMANMFCHLTLRDLKVPGRTRTFPAGGKFLFDQIACPHYFFEIMSWVGFNIVAGFPLSSSLFCSLGAIIMSCYAVERHEMYKRKFKDYPLHRTPIVPLLDIRPPQFLVAALGRE